MPTKILRCWLAMRKSGMLLRSDDAKCLRFALRFGLGCEHPRCQIASDVGCPILHIARKLCDAPKKNKQGGVLRYYRYKHRPIRKSICAGPLRRLSLDALRIKAWRDAGNVRISRNFLRAAPKSRTKWQSVAQHATV